MRTEPPAPDRPPPPPGPPAGPALWCPTVDAIVRQGARAWPDAVALDDLERTLTYRELADGAARLAAGLRSLAIGPGARLAFLAHNSLEYTQVFYACAWAGGMSAGLNWRLTDDELADQALLLEPTVLVVDETGADRVPLLLAAVPSITAVLALGPRPVEVGAVPDRAIRSVSVDELLHSPGPPLPVQDIDPEQPMGIFLTSGTTGRPKGIVLSHRAMAWRALTIAWLTGSTAEDACIAWLPAFHNGGVDPVVSAHSVGQRVVVLPRFDADAIAGVVAQRRIGWLQAVPGTIEALADAVERSGQVAGVRVIGFMADLIPPDQVARLTKAVGAPYLNSYGTSETSMAPGSYGAVTAGAVDYDLAKRELPFCDVRLIDDAGREVPEGEAGTVVVRTPMMFSGYWRDPERTEQAFHEGWYRTGDVMRRRPDGRLVFLGRESGMIKSGGESVFPDEVESVLHEHEAVTDAVVVGRPDRKWGEVPVAYVVVRGEADEAALLAHCRARLPGYKTPKAITVIDDSTITRNVTGKIPRAEFLAKVATLTAQEGERP